MNEFVCLRQWILNFRRLLAMPASEEKSLPPCASSTVQLYPYCLLDKPAVPLPDRLAVADSKTEADASIPEPSVPLLADHAYLDLGSTLPTVEQLCSADEPRCDRLDLALDQLLEVMVQQRWSRLRAGINELLKDYLRSLLGLSAPGTFPGLAHSPAPSYSNTGESTHCPAPDPDELTRRYMDILSLIFEYCQSSRFPYRDSLWGYFSDCLRSVGLTLAEHRQWSALAVLITETAAMGRQAAREGLPTAPLQHLLRRLESACLSGNAPEIAQLAKNLRFTLEV
ncbi:hypothetical protein [Heliophilum fasciatum]|uniref:Uncharacterized protein n=1 Tax=Heliophilum fasciatum TaxID=35700 RepID=A0A4R2RZ29_9FIRM|nr:hypothetical protein [Heliophilum fasciatum]MCW2277249.1 hypothetical protein [Heliophilum fasciatum]TCP68117.1 hypothetical protein EDD73_10419 [Heliophilum fasciatum]